MKKTVCILIILCMAFGLSVGASDAPETNTDKYGADLATSQNEHQDDVAEASYIIDDFWLSTAAFTGNFAVKSAVLIEASTGKVLYSQSPDTRLPIASVTKIMTLLLAFEAIDNGVLTYDGYITASEHASSMGGSQMYLEVGEKLTVDDTLKAIAVASANDAAVAMAEAIGGSEETFAEMMNAKALSLGCTNTHFVNASGLPEADAYSSAMDVALISQELIKHTDVYKYTTIWMDTLRGGAFGINNTNKLIRYYPGATGLKTGYTAEAGYCLSGTAERDGMTLIAVVLGGATSNERFACAKAMLDYGYATYRMTEPAVTLPDSVKVVGGKQQEVKIEFTPLKLLDTKTGGGITASYYLNESVSAPIAKGDKIGYVLYTGGGTEIARADITAAEDVETTDFVFLFFKTLKSAFLID